MGEPGWDASARDMLERLGFSFRENSPVVCQIDSPVLGLDPPTLGKGLSAQCSAGVLAFLSPYYYI